MQKKPKELVLVGDSRSFQHKDGVFATLAANHPCVVAESVPRTLWFAIAENITDALVASTGKATRILAADRDEQEQVMSFLTGDVRRLRVGDPVWLWNKAIRTTCLYISDANGKKLGHTELGSNRKPHRIRTPHGVVNSKWCDIALVETPRRYGAARPEVLMILPCVSKEVAKIAARSAIEAVIGVGRAPF